MKAGGGITNASFRVLANNSNSQINIHIPYGGVYPALAKREHTKNLPIILEKTLEEAKLLRQGLKSGKPFDAIAITYGPGLEICLWEGITFAKSLAEKWKIPLIPVNHMEGHIFSVFGKNNGTFKIPKIKFPMLSLLVSGGHTQLVLTEKLMKYKIIGETADDAVGEAFDKVARMLDLPYPGGPQISKLAEEERERIFLPLNKGEIERGSKIKDPSPTLPLLRGGEIQVSLPRPMLYTKDFNFSFSGLKTAVMYLIKDLGGAENLNKKTKARIVLEFENAAVECLVYKTAKAMEKYKIKTLIVAGGVSANKHLQNEMKKIAGKKVKLFFPPKELTGDNSIMIGIVGYLNYIKNKKKVPKLSSIKATGNLRL